MFDFSTTLNMPLIWGVLIATAIFLYVLLDGFDLGIGILFPFAPSDNCRNRMMNSIAPFWDGNETWLVLGGGGLFAAFPLGLYCAGWHLNFVSRLRATHAEYGTIHFTSARYLPHSAKA